MTDNFKGDNEDFTREQAIALHEVEVWKWMTLKQRGIFQLFCAYSCMPFGQFHEGIESVLGRSVFTHEFANSTRLRIEYYDLNSKVFPSREDLVKMLPSEYRHFVAEAS